MWLMKSLCSDYVIGHTYVRKVHAPAIAEGTLGINIASIYAQSNGAYEGHTGRTMQTVGLNKSPSDPPLGSSQLGPSSTSTFKLVAPQGVP